MSMGKQFYYVIIVSIKFLSEKLREHRNIDMAARVKTRHFGGYQRNYAIY